jgi:hypothetical protein
VGVRLEMQEMKRAATARAATLSAHVVTSRGGTWSAMQVFNVLQRAGQRRKGYADVLG